MWTEQAYRRRTIASPFFSNDKPKGVPPQNWVKTLPDTGFFVYISYYRSLNAFNEKTWILNDVELVK